jgi:polyhydroxyalkanoate synthesis repressor PhaR
VHSSKQASGEQLFSPGCARVEIAQFAIMPTNGAAMAEPIPAETTPPVTIKKYANRRLYNTATSSYVTLDHLCQMVKDGTDFVVYDAKTGDDITRSVLTQIIVEEEGKGQNLLPISFLRQLIGFYGDNLQWLVPGYLEHTMKSFHRNQAQMRTYLQDALGGLFPFGQFEEMGKQNIAMFERTMKMFTPFAGPVPGAGPAPGVGATPTKEAAAAESEIEALKAQLAQLQKQLDALSKKE